MKLCVFSSSRTAVALGSVFKMFKEVLMFLLSEGGCHPQGLGFSCFNAQFLFLLYPTSDNIQSSPAPGLQSWLRKMPPLQWDSPGLITVILPGSEESCAVPSVQYILLLAATACWMIFTCGPLPLLSVKLQICVSFYKWYKKEQDTGVG